MEEQQLKTILFSTDANCCLLGSWGLAPLCSVPRSVCYVRFCFLGLRILLTAVVSELGGRVFLFLPYPVRPAVPHQPSC